MLISCFVLLCFFPQNYAKDLNANCSQNSDCVNGMVCDTDLNECRIKMGGLCDTDNEKLCATGLVCDSNSVCKKRIGSKCDAEKKEKSCPAGAACLDQWSVCACDSKHAVTYDGITCGPRYGKSGGWCIDKCLVSNGHCVRSVCVCDDGFTADHFFNCVSLTGAFTEGTSPVRWTLPVVLLGLLSIIVFIIVAVRRQRHKKAALTEIQESRKEVMRTIAALKVSADTLTKAPQKKQPIVEHKKKPSVESESSDAGSSDAGSLSDSEPSSVVEPSSVELSFFEGPG